MNVLDNETFEEVTRTSIEIMESDKQLYRMYDFFEGLLEKREYQKARSIAWTMYFQWVLEVDGLRN